MKFWQRGNIEKFEKQFAEFVNAKYALSFPYARSAIWALLKSNHNNRDEVIVSAYTCTVVAHAVIKAGLRPRFVDIELDTYNPKIEEILAAVSDKTRAIIPVHTYGNVMGLDGLINKLPRKDVLIIEDSALCPKPIYKNSGYSNIVSIYSLGHTKHFSTVEGGIVATDNEEIYKKLLEFRNKNFARPSLAVHFKNMLHFFIRYFLFGKIGYYFLDALKNLKMLERFYDERSMDEVSLPKDYNVLFSEWQARLGLSQLAKSEEILEKRRKIAEFYYSELKNFHPVRSQMPEASAVPQAERTSNGVHPEVIPQPISHSEQRGSHSEPSEESNQYWSHYPVRIIARDVKMIREKMKQKGIEAGVTFDYSLPDLPIFRKYKDRDFQNSRKASGEMINLPNYPSLNFGDAEYIVRSLKSLFLV